MNTSIDATQAFTSWLQACQSSPWDPLTLEAAAPYGHIWNSWSRHIAPTPWDQATATQVLTFLDAARPEHKAQASDITRRRYWRVLDRVYEHAQIMGHTKTNPAQEVSEDEKPEQEIAIGAILSLRMWATMQKHLPDTSTPTKARDRAMLLALIECGLTPQELCKLKLSDVTASALHLEGPRQAQERVLKMGEGLGAAIADYQRQRPLFGVGAQSDLFFVSRSDGGMTTHTILQLTNKYLAYTARMEGLPMPPKAGPQIIRNTRIVHWLLQGLPTLEVLQLAGLKSPAALLHLRNCLPEGLRAMIVAAAAQKV